MTIQLQNTYSSSLSNIQLLQANGQEVTGAAFPDGIAGRIFIADGCLNTVLNENDALVPGSSAGRSEILTVGPLGYGNYFIEFEFRVDSFPAIPMSIMQIMDKGSVTDKPIHTLFIDSDGVLCAGLIRSDVLKVIGSVKVKKNAWNQVNLFFRSFDDATGWLHSMLNGRTLAKKHNINFFEPSGLGPYLKNGIYDYFGLTGFGSFTAKYRNMKISSITTETYYSEMGGYPMRSL